MFHPNSDLDFNWRSKYQNVRFFMAILNPNIQQQSFQFLPCKYQNIPVLGFPLVFFVIKKITFRNNISSFLFSALSLSVLTNKKFKSSQSQTISMEELTHLVSSLSPSSRIRFYIICEYNLYVHLLPIFRKSDLNRKYSGRSSQSHIHVSPRWLLNTVTI